MSVPIFSWGYLGRFEGFFFEADAFVQVGQCSTISLQCQATTQIYVLVRRQHF